MRMASPVPSDQTQRLPSASGSRETEMPREEGALLGAGGDDRTTGSLPPLFSFPASPQKPSKDAYVDVLLNTHMQTPDTP